LRYITILFLLVFSLNASYIKWQSDYEKAHIQALKENKNLLILLVDKSSSELIKNSFLNQDYVEEINREFVSVYIVKNQKGSYPVELLYTLEYPALFFLNKYEVYSCESLSGDLTPELITKRLKECF